MSSAENYKGVSLESSGVPVRTPATENAMLSNFSIANILHEKDCVESDFLNDSQAEGVFSPITGDVPKQTLLKLNAPWPSSSNAEGVSHSLCTGSESHNDSHVETSHSLEFSDVPLRTPSKPNASWSNFSIDSILCKKRCAESETHSNFQAEGFCSLEFGDVLQKTPVQPFATWPNFPHNEMCAVRVSHNNSQEENFYCLKPGSIPQQKQPEPNFSCPNISVSENILRRENGNKSRSGLQENAHKSCAVFLHNTLNPNIPWTTFSIAEDVLRIELELCAQLDSLVFSPPIEYIYSPIEYAFNLHAQFVRKFCNASKKVMFLGMNPGPWGMSQTGVPFGEIAVVRDWFAIQGSVGKPKRQHPSRLVTGLECHRSEISGKRFWGLFQELCGPDPFVFFKNSFIYNLCPIALLSNSGKNITPAEIKASESKALLTLCEAALARVVCLLQVEVIVAVGKFAEKRACIAVNSIGLKGVKVVSIPHPSPRNASNGNNWKELATKNLENLGLLKLFLPT